jgi:hypothetical protein
MMKPKIFGPTSSSGHPKQCGSLSVSMSLIAAVQLGLLRIDLKGTQVHESNQGRRQLGIPTKSASVSPARICRKVTKRDSTTSLVSTTSPRHMSVWYVRSMHSVWPALAAVSTRRRLVDSSARWLWGAAHRHVRYSYQR